LFAFTAVRLLCLLYDFNSGHGTAIVDDLMMSRSSFDFYDVFGCYQMGLTDWIQSLQDVGMRTMESDYLSNWLDRTY